MGSEHKEKEEWLTAEKALRVAVQARPAAVILGLVLLPVVAAATGLSEQCAAELQHLLKSGL